MELRSLIEKGFKASGFDLSPQQRDSLAILLQELERWNRKINLTGLKSDEALVKVLLLGSAAFLSAHTFRAGEKVLDLGSGAGFPGIPLKILFPEMDLTLLEANGKKIAFLKHAVRTLKLSEVRCMQGRAEELGRKEEMRESFQAVTARAAGKLGMTLEVAAPFIACGGLFITIKGSSYPAELEAAMEAASRVNMEFLRAVSPPWADRSLHLLVFKKVPTKHFLD